MQKTKYLKLGHAPNKKNMQNKTQYSFNHKSILMRYNILHNLMELCILNHEKYTISCNI